MAQKDITHIEKVEIKNLWGKYDIDWKLNPNVNILIGINGSGKTTILNLLNVVLRSGEFDDTIFNVVNEVNIFLNNDKFIRCSFPEGTHDNLLKKLDEALPLLGFLHINADEDKEYNPYKKFHATLITSNLDFDSNKEKIEDFIKSTFISTFDMALRNKEVVEKLSNDQIRTDLDFELHQLINEFIRYQLTLGKQVEKLFLEAKNIDVRAKREEIYGKKNLFINIVNHLLEKTGKVIDSDEQEHIIFRQGDTILTPYQLSSGEKQMLIILLKVLLQNNQPAILLMDEPESSLHLEWQEHLIDYILQLNEHVQIIIATHSPGIMMKGWLDKVTEIETITKAHS